MRVGFNARLLYGPTLRGWNRYTVNLLAELPARGVEPYLYSDRPLHDSHLARLPAGGFQVRVAPPMRYVLWEQHWLPRQCRADGVDVLHCPLNFGLPWRCPCPRVLTLHDAIDQVYYQRRTPLSVKLTPAHLQTRVYHWTARTCAEAVITVSEHARGDLVRHLRVPVERITVIPEAAAPGFGGEVPRAERTRVRAAHAVAGPYVFYVGGWELRKNVPFLLRAFAAAALTGVELVLAGGKPEEKEQVRRLGDELGVGNRLRLLGWVADADLPALYAEALCFVYPSEYEGFGLQACEAMACGCPTLVARATSLPEVVAGGGETFSLRHTRELIRLLQRVARDEGYRQRLQASALDRARDFSWGRTADDTVKVYRRLLEKRSRLAA